MTAMQVREVTRSRSGADPEPAPDSGLNAPSLVRKPSIPKVIEPCPAANLTTEPKAILSE
jgi:hypothetical protein